MSSTRLTFGSVLNTVTSAATAATSLLDTTNDAVGMLNSYVKTAAANQRNEQIARQSSNLERIIDEVGLEDTQRQLKINQWVESNPGADEVFQANRARLRALFKTE